MSVVFLVQALLFADGGITALGTNIDLMGLVTVVVGWLVFRLLQAVLPKRLAHGRSGRRRSPRWSRCRSRRSPSSLLYAVGGTADIPLGQPGDRDGRRGTC